MVLEKINKTYGNNIIFKDLSCEFEEGKITAVLGESGVGKTTLINIIAGLTDFSGKVECDKISVVFQEDRLIPNLTVKDNLKIVNPNVEVEKELESVGLIDAINKFPSELSAGMARRVAILRALICNNPLLLMDEPLRNLDYAMKYKLMDLFKEYHQEYHNTIIFVTQSIDEAVYLADRVVILGNEGIVKDIRKIRKNSREEILKFFIGKK